MERFGRSGSQESTPTQMDQAVEPENVMDDEDEDDYDGDFDETVGESAKRGYCSFVHTMPRADSKGEKFSYLVAQKRQGERKNLLNDQFEGVDLLNLLNETRDTLDEEVRLIDVYKRTVNVESKYLNSDTDDLGLELLVGDERRSNFGRIVHAPKKKKGHILIDCCAGPGKIVRHVVGKSLSKRAPGIYAAARKSRWGGFWPNIDED